MQKIDTCIHAKWIIPVEVENQFLIDHCICVDNGIILEIIPSNIAKEKYTASSSHVLERHIICPGFINAHTHAAMSLFKGIADDLPLMDWLNNHIWPAESKWISNEFVHDGTMLAIAEMLKSGTTCFNDMYFFPDAVANAASSANIRAVIGMIMIDFPTAWASDPSEYLEKGLKLYDEYKNNPQIKTIFAPHAPYTVSDEPLIKIRTLADELDIPVHMHVHETQDEVESSLKSLGMPPISRLDQLDLLSNKFLAVHMTQLSDSEIKLIAKNGVHVIHCPESNMKLASGFCPIDKLINNNINVALGTDGSASNNDLDMIGEMRSAAMLAKVVAKDAAAVSAYQALKMATINGAVALGLDRETGSLKTGKSADIVAINAETINAYPLYNPISHLVYVLNGRDVSDVWIQGKHVLNESKLTFINESDLKTNVVQWQNRIEKMNKTKQS